MRRSASGGAGPRRLGFRISLRVLARYGHGEQAIFSSEKFLVVVVPLLTVTLTGSLGKYPVALAVTL